MAALLLFHGLWKTERERNEEREGGVGAEESTSGAGGGGWVEEEGGGGGRPKAFGLVPVEPAFWHAAFQEINTMVFPFTPNPHQPPCSPP